MIFRYYCTSRRKSVFHYNECLINAKLAGIKTQEQQWIKCPLKSHFKVSPRSTDKWIRNNTKVVIHIVKDVLFVVLLLIEKKLLNVGRKRNHPNLGNGFGKKSSSSGWKVAEKSTWKRLVLQETSKTHYYWMVGRKVQQTLIRQG